MAGYIVCFDSGLGGLTTLAAARHLLPEEDFLYFADTAHTPYGGRPRKEVLALTRAALERLQPYGLKAVLLACNTATSAAAGELRQKNDYPVLGLEPAVKPALEQTQGQVLVLGTELTVQEQKFTQLLKGLPRAQRVTAVACPGLVELIEQSPEHPQILPYLQQLLTPYLPAVQALVLGCTHYVFLRPLLRRQWPGLAVFDGNAGVSRHLQHVLAEQGLAGGTKRLLYCSSGGPQEEQAFAERCRRYYDYCESQVLPATQA